MAEEARFSIGVDLGGTKIAAAAVDGADRVTAYRRRPTLGGRGPSPIIADLVAVIRETLDEIGQERLPVGVAVCGQVSSAEGVVLGSPNLSGWTDVPLRARLEEALGWPVEVANDGHLIALGEWRALPERTSPFVVVYVGTGVGGGVVVDGEPLVGHGGYAAELGHMTIVVDGRPCRCGNLGCLEAYAGGWAIAERAREALEGDPALAEAILQGSADPEEITAEHVALAYDRGEAAARRLVEEVGRALGAGLVSVVNAFNPRWLVVGGGVVEGIPDLVELAARHVLERALPACVRDLEILPGRTDVDAGVVGAAAYARARAEG